MTKKKKLLAKKLTKTNIPFRRKMGSIYAKSRFLARLTVLIIFGLFVFTEYFASFKAELLQNIYEITANSGFKLKNVIIDGQKNTPSSDILTALNADTGTPIFAINIKEIQNNLQNNPWVKEVYVGRRWPNSIYIKLYERVPIAIWQINRQLFLIDEEGYKITKDIKAFSYLLQVVGPDANVYAGKLVSEIAKYPAISSRSISAVRYGDRRWDLNLQENVTVKMSASSFEESLKYINSLNRANKLFNQNYKIIDLRDNTKYYIERH